MSFSQFAFILRAIIFFIMESHFVSALDDEAQQRTIV